MNTESKNIEAIGKIFTKQPFNFNQTALDVFQFQYQHNNVYNQYCTALQVNAGAVNTIEKIPFLPVGFFKTPKITCTNFEPEIVFESSGTTQTINSKHYLKSTALYRQSFTTAFNLFYGKPQNWCIIALLPSYLERNNSSLVSMADTLIKQSQHPQSGFYLNEFDSLFKTLSLLENQQQQTLLIGATFALLDFAEQYPMHVQHTTVMETGGMKGRRKEITRNEVHDILCKNFKLKTIHSEYGMTELLSQAYSKGNGIFNCPAWMKILVREEDDPLAVQHCNTIKTISGAANIIDLANIYSCSFIATDDAVKLHSNESFEVLGRLDNSGIRGCSLLTL